MKQYGTYWYNYIFDSEPEKIERVITEYTLELNNKKVHINILENSEEEEQFKPQYNVLFIHGTAVYSRFYAEFLYRLSQEGYRIIAPDMPGHGLSEGERGHFTMDTFLSVISELITYIQANYGGKIVIMGSSLGGITSLYAIAKEDDRLNGAICHNAAIFNEKAHKIIVEVNGFLKLFKPLVPAFAKLFPKLKISVWTYLDPYELGNSEKFHKTIETFLKDPLLADKYTLTSLRTQMKAPLPKPIEKIDSPVMIINGEKDSLFSVDYMTELYQRLNCCNKKLGIIPNGSHLILQEHIDESLRYVVSFLEDLL